jgi:lipoprotein-anchoring transpeptidase ErfK/SrfK
MRLRRVGVLVAVTAVAVVLAACGADATAKPVAAPVHHRHPHPHPHPQRTEQAASIPLDVGLVPKATEVAATDGAIPGYPAPNQPSNMTVPSNWYGYPSILPVIATQPGWLEVRLAQRPNGSTTWVQASDVTLSTTPYAIVVDLSTEHLTVYEDGTLIYDFPAGIGTPDDPTPTGNYFMTMQVPPPTPAYGAFVLATSDHSDSITDWEDSGDAIIGIHGPITSYDDSLIGTTGAAISHGCIRLHDADLAELAGIPAGTPINIVN